MGCAARKKHARGRVFLSKLNAHPHPPTLQSAPAAAAAAATLLAAGNATAATEVATLAAGDSRLLIIGTLFLPVIGWVAFNILGPALNQLQAQAAKNAGAASAPAKKAPFGKKKRGVAAGLGLTAATLFAASAADAATDVATLAAGDGRAGAIALLLVPLLGVVALNIGQPALNQLAAMGEKQGGGKPAKAGRRR